MAQDTGSFFDTLMSNTRFQTALGGLSGLGRQEAYANALRIKQAREEMAAKERLRQAQQEFMQSPEAQGINPQLRALTQAYGPEAAYRLFEQDRLARERQQMAEMYQKLSGEMGGGLGLLGGGMPTGGAPMPAPGQMAAAPSAGQPAATPDYSRALTMAQLMRQMGGPDLTPSIEYQVEEGRRRQDLGIKAEERRFNQADKLRDEYVKQAEPFIVQRDAYQRVLASAQDPSPAGDLSLLFNYMKVLDPGSVVRESEFATAAKTGSLPQQIQVYAEKVLSGERLTPAQRADFVARSSKLYQSAERQYGKLTSNYQGLAEKFNLDPEIITMDLGRVQTPNPDGNSQQFQTEEEALQYLISLPEEEFNRIAGGR